MFDNLLMFESPVQILIVLTIALLVFGPKKLPEIGRQIGGALRELRKAAGEVSRSFSTDYEPETTSYSYDGGSSTYDRTASYYTPPASINAPADLTDYTIVGVTVPQEQQTQSTAESTDAVPEDLTDYTLTGALLARTAVQSNGADGASGDSVPPAVAA